MSAANIIYIAVFFGVVLACVKPLGIYIANVMEGKAIFPLRVGASFESALYRGCGVDAKSEMNWKQYAIALLLFNALGVLVVYALQRLQVWLPFNPQGMANVTADSSVNTAISFVTNTNWQGYAGETTMGYLVQMSGLAVQNFLSAATGIVVAIALVRGLARHSAQGIGNFWVDITRATLYILLPLSIVVAVVLLSQGVIQNFDAYKEVAGLQSPQTLAMGPVASQEAIKELGTNGGGFFNANSAHPFENPTPFSNFIEILAILLIPTALAYSFGYMVGDRRQGWAVLAAMLILLVSMMSVAQFSEQDGNPQIAALGVDQNASPLQSGGNMEGKEARFGIGASALFAAVTTGTSCGAVNSMHDSYTPMGGLVPLFLMQLGEVAPGGVGTGLYSMLVFAIIGVFIAGLMIGRTPEYIGKKIESFEMKMASLVILVMPFLVLVGTAVAVMVEPGKVGVANPGAHGFSEILYAFSSAANNNGSAFAGLSANTPFYNTMLGLAMWFGRFWPIVAVLAIAGSLAAKKRIPVTAGTMPTHGPLFVTLLIGTVLLVGALTFVPALALGPIVEQVMLWPAN
jgi:K+-transporting ATPase ATPase A chain